MFSSEQRVPQESNTFFEIAVAITLCFQLCSACYKVLQTKNSRSASATIQSPRKYDNSHAPTINYCLKNTAAITFCFELFSARYTASQTKNSVIIVFTINLVTMEKTDDSRFNTNVLQRSHVSCYTLGCQQKEMGHKGGQR